MLIRSCKVLLVAAVAVFYALFAIGNLDDPASNLAAIGHVMSMDTLSPESGLTWRALANPLFHHLAFWLIVAWQFLTAAILLLGAAALWGERDSGPAFQQAKGLAVLGLVLGILLYLVGFLTIAGEWFAMWQSKDWNGQQSGFRILLVTGFVLIVLLLRDDNAADR